MHPKRRSQPTQSKVEQLAGVLLDDAERIAEFSVARMQELLPSYAKVPAEQLTPPALTSTRDLLDAISDPNADPSRAEEHFRVLSETRLNQGIAACRTPTRTLQSSSRAPHAGCG